jgi:NACalpha-BTF3-like transcription factor
MNLIENIDNIIKIIESNIGRRSGDVLKSLFDGKEKKRAFLKSSNMIDKVIGKIFLSSTALDGKIGLNAEAMKKVLKQKGFSPEEITAIRELAIKSAKKVSRYIAKKHDVESKRISQIPKNFSVYSLPISSDEVEKDFNKTLKDEIRRELKRL